MSAMPSAPKTTLYNIDQHGTVALTREQAGEVRLGNYVYDLWVPLLGVAAIGVYSVYVRLARSGHIYGLSLTERAKACRVGKATLGDIEETLQDCGFIKVTNPDGAARLKHFTSDIQVFPAPASVSPQLRIKYGHPSGYTPLAPWLVDYSGNTVVSDRTADSSNQNRDMVSGGTTKIESLFDLESSVFESSDQIQATYNSLGERAHTRAPEGELVNEKKEGASKKETANRPTLTIVKPIPSKPPSPIHPPIPLAPPPSPRPDTSRQAADEACTLVDLAIEQLCYGTQFVAWQVDRSRVQMRAALREIERVETEPLTPGLFEQAGQWWYANDWRGKKRGDKPRPGELVEVWARFVASRGLSIAPQSSTGYERFWTNLDEEEIDARLDRFLEDAAIEQKIEVERKARVDNIPVVVDQVWLATLGQLQVQLNRATYNTWLGHCKLYESVESDDCLHIVASVPHSYSKDWLDKHLHLSMVQTLNSFRLGGWPLTSAGSRKMATLEFIVFDDGVQDVRDLYGWDN